MNELGKLLRKLRGNESLREVSKRAGISHNYLSILEKGIDPQTKSPVNPSAETLKKLSSAYNYPYEELLKIAGILNITKDWTIKEKDSVQYHFDNDKDNVNLAFVDGGEDLSEEEIEYLRESLQLFRKLKEREKGKNPEQK